MIQGLVLIDGSGTQGAGFGAHVREGNASDTFAAVYFQTGGGLGTWISRKSDPLTFTQNLHNRGCAQTGRGRTWDFVCRAGQTGG